MATSTVAGVSHQRVLSWLVVLAAVFILACDNGCFWQDVGGCEDDCCVTLQSIVSPAAPVKAAPPAVAALLHPPDPPLPLSCALLPLEVDVGDDLSRSSSPPRPPRAPPA
ncbi:MAG: hypothetical protein FJX76_04245 [Armatimonadetes bacterium]|nr:hypothetical protein [Armatimonadota bacterium]